MNARSLRGCREHFESAGHIFAHANCDPDLPLHATEGGTLRWRHLDPPVQRPHRSGKTAVVGHTPQVGGEVLDLGFLV